jgi:hypothetical protein
VEAVEYKYSPSDPEAMGGLVAETLQVALGPGGAATVLAGSVAAWLATRRQVVSVRFKRADGAEFELTAAGGDADEAIGRFLGDVPAAE